MTDKWEKESELSWTHVKCRSIFCDAEPVKIPGETPEEIEQNKIKLIKSGKCEKCGNIGMMPCGHIMPCIEILKQIERTKSKILWKDLFKTINYDKFPRNISQQELPYWNEKRKRKE